MLCWGSKFTFNKFYAHYSVRCKKIIFQNGTQTTDAIERPQTRTTELYFVSKSKDDSMTVTKKISKLCLASSKAHFQICQNYFFEKSYFMWKKIYFLISFNERWWFSSWTAAKCSISRGSGFKSLLFSLLLSLISLYLTLSLSSVSLNRLL